MKTRRLTPLVLSLALTLAPTASADPGTHLTETLALSPAPSRDDVSAAGLSLTLDLDSQSSAGWFFGVTAGATFTAIESASIGSSSALDPGNLAIQGGHRLTTRALELGLGVHLAVPLALYWRDGIEAKRTTEHGHLAASTARGQRDAWLWQMNTIPAGLTLELDLPLGDHLAIALEAEPTALVSLNSRPTRLALLTALELRARWRPLEVRLGWSCFASTLALENLDHDQHAAWLGLDLHLGHHELGLTTTVNLDGPWGAATGEAKPTWGLELNVRHRL